jgi:type IV secretion system protein VirB8
VAFFPSPSSKPPLIEDEQYIEQEKPLAVQRTLLVLLIVVTFGISMTVLIRLYQATSNKTLSPFVMEIEERTGLTKVITPVPPEKYETDATIRDFYIRRYITARESYSLASYKYYYNTVIAALSSDYIFNNFKNFIYSTHIKIKQPSPEAQASLVRIDSRQEIAVTVEAIRPLEEGGQNIPGQVIQVYFNQYPIGSFGSLGRQRIATIGYNFDKKGLEGNALELNPLRFQVLYYSLTDVTTGKL